MVCNQMTEQPVHFTDKDNKLQRICVTCSRLQSCFAENLELFDPNSGALV